MTDLHTDLEALVAAEEARVAEAHARWDAEGRTFISGKPWRIAGIIGTQALRKLLAKHPTPTADREATAEETGYRVGALPPYSVTHIDGDHLGIGGGHRWHVMGTVDGSPRNPQGPVAVCEWEPTAHAIAALLNAPTADRDEVADVLCQPYATDPQALADALQARFDIRRKA